MTLVLPFGCDQISNNSIFLNSNQNSSMPCVFDSEAFDRDLESALMTDWTSDITDYDVPSADSSVKAPSVTNDLKRKCTDSDIEQQPTSKKVRVPSDNAVTPLRSTSSSSSSLSAEDASSSRFDTSSLPSSSASSSSEGAQDDDMSTEDESYLPRRRGPQMWNSRQRWKDERKKVLKMSINKLADIEDPELCLSRSVLINNTIKKLHLDIRNERQAKLRHRQQLRTDFFAAASHSEDTISECFSLDFSNNHNDAKTNSMPSDEFQDDSSCDEIFGINDDFLRVPVPDRRVSSPVPSAPANNRTDIEANDCCDIATDSGSFRSSQKNSQSALPASYSQATPTPPYNNRRIQSGGSQCATQYRTNRDVGEAAFPPRVPILDSVVYHSLLASLESS